MTDKVTEWLDVWDAYSTDTVLAGPGTCETIRKLIAFVRNIKALCDDFEAQPYPEHPSPYEEGLEDGQDMAYLRVRGAFGRLVEGLS